MLTEDQRHVLASYDQGMLADLIIRPEYGMSRIKSAHAGSWALLDDDGNVFRPVVGRDRCVRCGFHVPTQKHRSGCQEA